MSSHREPTPDELRAAWSMSHAAFAEGWDDPAMDAYDDDVPWRPSFDHRPPSLWRDIVRHRWQITAGAGWGAFAGALIQAQTGWPW